MGSLSHCMSYHRVLQPTTHLGSLSHCIFQAQGSLTRNISGIFIPLHISSSGFFNPQHIWDLYPTACHIIGFFDPQHSWDLYPTASRGTCSHCIAYLRSLSHCIVTTYQGIYPSSYHEISIPLHCIAYHGSLSHCISHLRDFTPTALHI